MIDIRTHDRILFFLGSTGVLSGIFLTNVFEKNSLFFLIFLSIVSIQILFLYHSFWRYILIVFITFCLGIGLSLLRLQTIETTTDIFQKQTAYFSKEVVIQGTLSKKISENSK